MAANTNTNTNTNTSARYILQLGMGVVLVLDTVYGSQISYPESQLSRAEAVCRGLNLGKARGVAA